MALKDSFGREHVYLRISVTDRCNLRCVYCMPNSAAFHPHSDLLTADEIERLVTVLGGLGICKVRLTGGEPTVRREIIEICKRVRAVPGIETVALTTNGARLAGLAGPLRDAGVERLNISLDSIRRARFEGITGKDRLRDVLAGVDAAFDVGFRRLKINTVVMAGVNDDELLDFVELARTRPLEIRFIELMPFKGTRWRPERFLPCADMMARIRATHALVPHGTTTRTGGVAQDFIIDGFAGRISFITPFSDSFCSRCNRLRVTADGRLKACLYGPADTDLRGLVRRGASDAELEQAILSAVDRKPAGHEPLHRIVNTAETVMHQVGG